MPSKEELLEGFTIGDREILPGHGVFRRGDVDGAMAIALELERPGETFQVELLLTPELRPLRDHPGFMPLLGRLGIVDYWQQAGCSFDGDKAVCAAD